MPCFWGWHIPDLWVDSSPVTWLTPLLISQQLTVWMTEIFFPNRFLKIPFVKKLAFFNDKRVFDYAIHMQDSSSRMGHFWLREECTSTVVHGLLRMCAGSLRPPSWYVRVWSWSKDAQCLSFDRSTVTVKYGFYRAINDSLYTTYVCPINFLTAG